MQTTINSLKQECEDKQKAIDIQFSDLTSRASEYDNIIKETKQNYPWLAQLFSDYEELKGKRIADDLRWKRRPALKASEEVKKITREKKDLIKLCKMYEYQLNYFENVFPWLEEFKEIDPRSAYDEIYNIDSESETKDEYSVLKSWLSPDEYSKLPNCEKYQLALDRYKKRPKSNREIGRDYERYIGYLYESKGCTVKYQGALRGYEDMGRDLIVENKGQTLVIQCKYWAKEKTIHEKHIFQLFGTTVLMEINDPNKIIKGVFITSIELSDVAKECAKHLGIEVIENCKYNKDYPMIKCNIGKDGEKIYHLPFDQQYDRILIDKKGEFFAHTVKEAKDSGFRRAFRWHGTDY